jgi:hypothetical protein
MASKYIKTPSPSLSLSLSPLSFYYFSFSCSHTNMYKLMHTQYILYTHMCIIRDHNFINKNKINFNPNQNIFYT